MEWIVFDNSDLQQYVDYIDNHKFSGIWHRPSWLEFQLCSGKAEKGFFFGIIDKGDILLCGLYLVMKSKTANYGYIPAGILYYEINYEIFDLFYKNLKDVSKSNKTFYTQIDSIIPYDDNYHTVVSRYSKNVVLNTKAPIPQYTNVVDLSLNEEEILAQMKPKGRYNIKLAEKKGVKIKVGDISDISTFYKILSETTVRDGFRPNNQKYYLDMLEILKESTLLLAYHEDDLISAGLFTFTKFQGLYYYGASANIKRNLMAPYLTQWEAIKLAKDKGCNYFDFMGIADPEKKDDPLVGVTDFKLKFSEKIIKFNTPIHIVHNKFLYNFVKIVRYIKKLVKKG